MNDSKDYREAYTTNRMVGRFKSYRRIIKKNFDKLIADIIKSFPNEFIKILDIGGGNGKSTIYVLNELKKAGKKFVIDYLDVSEVLAKEYTKNLQEAGFEKNIRKKKITSWEDYKVEDKYHIVLALHSWYGISNWEKDNENNTLRKVADCLEQKGRAYIVTAQRGSLWDMIGRNAGLIRVTGEDIIKALDNLGIKYQRVDLFDDVVEFSELYDNGLTKSGEEIISFILRNDFESLTEEQKKKLTKIVEGMKNNPKFAMDDLIIIFC